MLYKKKYTIEKKVLYIARKKKNILKRYSYIGGNTVNDAASRLVS